MKLPTFLCGLNRSCEDLKKLFLLRNQLEGGEEGSGSREPSDLLKVKVTDTCDGFLY